MATYNKKNIEDVVVSGKTVLVRCDFNVPMKDGVITSDKRIVSALPTIKYLLENGAKLVLCSHMGKPHAILTEGFGLTKKEKKAVEALPAEEQAAATADYLAKALVADMKKAVDAGYIVLPLGCSYEEGTTTGELIYSPTGVVSGDKNFEIVITFEWGAAFNGKNPGEYFDSDESFASYPDTAEGNAKVKKVLEDLRAMIYGYYDSFFVTNGETVDYSQPVSDSERASVIEAHKNDDAPIYKLVITATAN